MLSERESNYNTDYFESQYKELISEILHNGELRETRNGKTKSLFGRSIKVDLTIHKDFIPLLNNRKMYYNGVLGEFAAFMHNAKSVEEFKSFGCNYWELWADAEGRLELDYSEQLFNFNGINQLDNLIESLSSDPYSRRHIISLWRPDRFDKISLHCCHYSYQFYVTSDNQLDMIWNQRSVDIMVGLPSDIILAYLWVKSLSVMLGFKPGIITMNLGDCHIYEEHIRNSYSYLEFKAPRVLPKASFGSTDITKFTKDCVDVYEYDPHETIKFLLKA